MFHNNLTIKNEFSLRKTKTHTEIVKNEKKNLFSRIFSRKNKKESSGGVREFVSKLSSGLMLPIAMLPIAGLFLGIGSAIYNQGKAYDNATVELIGNIIKTPGDAVFSNLAVIFAIAIAIVFAEDAGAAGLSAFLGWLVFCALQKSLLIMNEHWDQKDPNSLAAWFLWFKFTTIQYNATFTANIGIDSLNTSVFGGIIVGFTVAKLYKRFRNTQMPQILGFFSGARFVPIITFLAMLPISAVFCCIWPYFGQGIEWFGAKLGLMAGFNSFIYCIVERFLVPFGLQHAFYLPLWQTAVGGSVDLTNIMVVWHNGTAYQVTQFVKGNQTVTFTTWLDFINKFTGKTPEYTTINGDQNIWKFMYSIAGVKIIDPVTHEQTYITFDFARTGFGILHDNGTITQGSSVNVTQYMEGRFPFMNFGLPAAAAAMVLAAPKEKRKFAFSAVFGAALTSFLTGITEPIEFTFLFLAPWLYYGFHAFMAGICGLALNLWHAHIGQTFAAGMIDFTIYGIIPDILHADAGSWKSIIIGVGVAPIYFFFFYWAIKQFNIATPGRGETTRLFTKKDFLAKKQANEKNNNTLNKLSGSEKEAYEVMLALGGIDNIDTVNACITKLRVTVKDPKKVDTKAIIALGAKGVTWPSKKSVYSIFGGKADIYKNHIRDFIKNQNKK